MKRLIFILVGHLALVGCGSAVSTGGGGGGSSATLNLVVENPDPTASGTSKGVLGKSVAKKSLVSCAHKTIGNAAL